MGSRFGLAALFDEAVSAAGSDPIALVHTLRARGYYRRMSARSAASVEDLERAWKLVEGLPDPVLRADLMMELGGSLVQTPRKTEAIEWFQRAADGYEEQGQYGRQAEAISWLGLRRGAAMKLDPPTLVRALGIAEAHGGEPEVALVAGRLAMAQCLEGAFAQARQTLDATFQWNQRLGARHPQATTLLLSAMLFALSGEPENAMREATRGLEHANLIDAEGVSAGLSMLHTAARALAGGAPLGDLKPIEWFVAESAPYREPRGERPPITDASVWAGLVWRNMVPLLETSSQGSQTP
jgi:hypothetical protein